MSPPQRTGGALGHHTENTASLNSKISPDQGADDAQGSGGPRRARAPVASAVRRLRIGSAKYDWDTVERCPFCAHSHRHVAFEGATSYQRHPACRSSVTYTVRVARVVPNVVLPGPRPPRGSGDRPPRRGGGFDA